MSRARVHALAFALLAGCGGKPPAIVAPPSASKEAGAAGWDLLSRTLPGSWTMPGKSGPFTVSYKLVSAGSALVEIWGAGTDRETMTVLHRDHGDLVLTHYCAQGNQPRLRAVSAAGNAVTFRFADVTDLEAGEAVLVERTLRVDGDALEDTEIYRAADGAPDKSVHRFTRVLAQ